MNIKKNSTLLDWPLTTSVFMTHSILLWWTLDSVLLPVVIGRKL